LSTLVTQVTVQPYAGCQKAVTRRGQVLLFVCCRQASNTAGAIGGGTAAAGGRCECSRPSRHLGTASSCQVKPLCCAGGPADTRRCSQPPGQGESCLTIKGDQHHCVGISTTVSGSESLVCVGISTMSVCWISTTVLGLAPLVCVGISTNTVCCILSQLRGKTPLLAAAEGGVQPAVLCCAVLCCAELREGFKLLRYYYMTTEDPSIACQKSIPTAGLRPSGGGTRPLALCC